jgi:hypothetical protein
MTKKFPPTGDISELDRYIYISICLYKTNSTASFHLDSRIPLGSHHLQQNLVSRMKDATVIRQNRPPTVGERDLYPSVYCRERGLSMLPRLGFLLFGIPAPHTVLPRVPSSDTSAVRCKGITEGDVVAVVRFGPATRFMGSFGLDLLSSLSNSISSSNTYLHACHIANVSLVVLHGEFRYHFRPVRRAGTNL